MKAQADQLAQLEQQTNHVKGALAAVGGENNQNLQKQRTVVAAAGEEVCLTVEVLNLCVLWCLHQW